MQVHIRTRRSKIKTRTQVPGDFQIHDNATALSVVKRQAVSRGDFEARLAQKSAKGVTTLVMTKDPKQCGLTEEFHYAEIHWTDRVTKDKYALIFDTMVFITDDAGSTTQTVEG